MIQWKNMSTVARAWARNLALALADGVSRCRANVVHIGQSRPDYGLGSQVKVLERFSGVPSSLGSGHFSPVAGVCYTWVDRPQFPNAHLNLRASSSADVPCLHESATGRAWARNLALALADVGPRVLDRGHRPVWVPGSGFSVQGAWFG